MVVAMVLVCPLSAFGITFRLAVGMRTVDNMRWDISVCKCGYYLNAYHSNNEKADQNICGYTGREASARQVLLRGGEHAIEGGKELFGISIIYTFL